MPEKFGKKVLKKTAGEQRIVVSYLFITVMLTILGIDQISKWFIINRFFPGESLVVIEGFLRLTYVQNRGGAFGILPGKSTLFIIISIIIIMGIILYNLKYPVPRSYRLVTGMIAGGALGNLIDRCFYNYVIDFFDLGWWPVFNIADIAIVCGGILLAVFVFNATEDSV